MPPADAINNALYIVVRSVNFVAVADCSIPPLLVIVLCAHMPGKRGWVGIACQGADTLSGFSRRRTGQSRASPLALLEAVAHLRLSPLALLEAVAHLRLSPLALLEAVAQLQLSPLALLEAVAHLRLSPLALLEAVAHLRIGESFGRVDIFFTIERGL